MTPATLNFPASLGCDRIQGFLFGKPVEAGDVQAVIQTLQQPPAETKGLA